MSLGGRDADTMTLSMFTPQEVTVLSKLPPRLRLEAVKRRAAVKRTVKPVDFYTLVDFTEKQHAATLVADTHKYTLYGGSRGPGKSYWLRWYALYRLLEFAKRGIFDVDVMLACEDYPSLTGRQINKISKEFPSWLGEIKSTQNKGLGFHIKPEYGGGSILLRNLDDPSKYQSFEFADIYIDELTKNPVRTFDLLRGSLRWPGIDDNKFAAATNPDANWVRDYWVEGRLPEELVEAADEFAFVAALPGDNPHLSQSYWTELNRLSGPLRQAWLHGDWYAAVEGLVFDNFTDDNLTDDEPNLDAPFELGIDEGYIDARAIIFVQADGARVLAFDEIYKSRQSAFVAVREILLRCVDMYAPKLGKERGNIWPDDDMLKRMNNRELSAHIQRHGVKVPELAAVAHEAVELRDELQKADIRARNWMAYKVGVGSTRVEAVKRTRELIEDGNGQRVLKVHRRARNLLDEIRAGYKYPEGKHKIDEHPADGNDHACEALENWVWLRLRKR